MTVAVTVLSLSVYDTRLPGDITSSHLHRHCLFSTQSIRRVEELNNPSHLCT